MKERVKARSRDSVLHEIRQHPELHCHDDVSLQECCWINGTLDLMLIDAHRRCAKKRAKLFGAPARRQVQKE